MTSSTGSPRSYTKETRLPAFLLVDSQLERLEVLHEKIGHLRKVSICEGVHAKTNVRVSRAVLIPVSLTKCRLWKILFRYACKRVESSDVELPSWLPMHFEISTSPYTNNAPRFSRATFRKQFVQEEVLAKKRIVGSLSDLGVGCAVRGHEVVGTGADRLLGQHRFQLSHTRSCRFASSGVTVRPPHPLPSRRLKGFTERMLAQGSTMLEINVKFRLSTKRGQVNGGPLRTHTLEHAGPIIPKARTLHQCAQRSAHLVCLGGARSPPFSAVPSTHFAVDRSPSVFHKFLHVQPPPSAPPSTEGPALPG